MCLCCKLISLPSPVLVATRRMDLEPQDVRRDDNVNVASSVATSKGWFR